MDVDVREWNAMLPTPCSRLGKAIMDRLHFAKSKCLIL